MRALAGFVLVAAAATAGLAAVGTVLMPRAYGPEAVEAVVWASAIALAGSLVGAVPLLPPSTSGAASASWTGPAGASRFLAAMLLRLGAVCLGALAVGVLGGLVLEPFLLWLAVCYLVLLAVDTVFALRTFRSL